MQPNKPSSIRWSTRAAIAASAMVFASQAVAAPRYVAVPIPTSKGLGSSASAINSAGDIAGSMWPENAFVAGEGGVAFRYFRGKVEDLGTLGGKESNGLGISDDGTVVGWARTISGLGQAFIHPGDYMRLLGPFNVTSSRATAMSPDGIVVGDVTPTSNSASTRAFVYANGNFAVPAGMSDVWSTAFGVNQAGEIVGTRNSANARAFVHANGSMRTLGTLGGQSSFGRAINMVGQTTGTAHDENNRAKAFIETGGQMVNLGTLGGPESDGFAINARGEVTGRAYVDRFSWTAFLYVDGAMYNLNELVDSGLQGAVLYEATAINDSGQIVANGCSEDQCRAFRLDPVAVPSVSAIEFRHAEFDHYFMTANADEIAKLDTDTSLGWKRTGLEMSVHRGAAVGTASVCRFFTVAFGARSSHFYTAEGGECAKVRQNAHWQLEGIAFSIALPDVDGKCLAENTRVYRLYNNGRGGAPNHRFTTSATVRAQMVKAGWISEGYGPDGVAMCAPA